MKGKKGGGLPVAPMMGANPQSGGAAVKSVISGNPDVIASAKKKTVPAAMGTSAKGGRLDRPGRKKGGVC